MLILLLTIATAHAETPKVEASHDSNMMVVMGGLDQSVITETMNRHNPQFRACAGKEKGRVAFRFVIDPKGHVSEAGITAATLKSEKAKDCLTNTLKKILFPEPLGGGVVEVDYPLSFPLEKK